MPIEAALNELFTTKIKVTNTHIECQTVCELNGAEYAFYLVIDGITVTKQWYKEEPLCSFRLEHDRTKEHSIVFFVRDGEGNIFKKTEAINQGR